MSYTKKTWKAGDTITAEALNNLESGASANASAIAEIEQKLPTYVGADVPRKAEATIIPSTSDQIIDAGQYLTGVQTIKGDENLIADSIKKGVSIFGVEGTSEADTSDATAEVADILDGKTAYIASGKVTGTLRTSTRLLYAPTGSSSGEASVSERSYTPAVGSSYKKIRVEAPSVTSTEGKTVVDASNVEIGVEVDCSDFGNAVAANVLSGKTFTATPGLKVKGTMTSKDAKTITPGVDDQIIASGQYLAGAQTIKGDSNLVAANIKKGTSIFGVTGILETGSTGTDTSDATATAGDILYGETAYVKGEKVTGTITIKGAQIYTPRATDQTILAGYYLKGNQTIEGDANLIADNIKKGVSIFGVIGTLEAGSAGKTVKTGSFTGAETEAVIETGLSSISAFMVYDTAGSLHAEGLVCAFIDAEGGISGRGIGCTSYSSYFKNVGVTDTNVLNVSGGTITVLASSTGYKPISNETYKWYAVGEA